MIRPEFKYDKNNFAAIRILVYCLLPSFQNRFS